MAQFSNINDKINRDDISDAEKKIIIQRIQDSDLWKAHQKEHSNANPILEQDKENSALKDKVEEEEFEVKVFKRKEIGFDCGCGKRFTINNQTNTINEYSISDSKKETNDYNISKSKGENQQYVTSTNNGQMYDGRQRSNYK